MLFVGIFHTNAAALAKNANKYRLSGLCSLICLPTLFVLPSFPGPQAE